MHDDGRARHLAEHDFHHRVVGPVHRQAACEALEQAGFNLDQLPQDAENLARFKRRQADAAKEDAENPYR